MRKHSLCTDAILIMQHDVQMKAILRGGGYGCFTHTGGT
jgi:hypothetical protein